MSSMPSHCTHSKQHYSGVGRSVNNLLLERLDRNERGEVKIAQNRKKNMKVGKLGDAGTDFKKRGK
jgi:hypothetical protein